MVQRPMETLFAIELLPLKITHSVRLSISRRHGDTVQGMDRRARIALNAFLSCLALAGFVWTASTASDDRSNEGIIHDGRTQHRLGVIIPTYRGDLDRAVSSLGHWPKICSTVTQENVDLVLYHTEEDDATAAAAIPTVAYSAGRCFARTRLVYANNLVDQVRTAG